MKEIVYRGGLVRFLIPNNWVEEYEQEGGIFYENTPDTGTLRLNVITAQSPNELGSDAAYQVLQSLGKNRRTIPIKRKPDGNAITSWIEHTIEDGEPITLFWWHVANPLPPRHIRLANFSYTVRTENETKSQTVSDVELLGSAIENAVFHPLLG